MSEPRFKPSRSGEQHKGYYGNKPVKAKDGMQGIKIVEKGMGVALRSPCIECPLRRDSAPGYLGGYTPEMYLEALHSPASLACHSSPGFHEGEIEKQRHCTGVAAYRANVGHICSAKHPEYPALIPTAAHESTKFIGHDEEHYFATPQEFYEHHKKGQEDELDTDEDA